jgi:hypothetical protein
MTSSTITCDAFDAALPEYLEGTLDEKRRAAVDGHLSECVRCASLRRDLENISEQAAALPDLVPSRDLWTGIEARIAAPVIPLTARPERQRRAVPAWMGIAAAALVVSTAGITYTLTARSLRPSGQTVALVSPPGAARESVAPEASSQQNATVPEGVNPSSGQGAMTQSIAQGTRADRPDVAGARLVSADQADQAHSDVVYGREIAMLQKIVSQRRTQLDSSTVAIIEKNLTIIDAAIEQSRAALVKDPASRLLGQQLTRALDKKVELLRTAALLPAST